jgi:lysine-specific demethylase 8
MSDTRAAVLDHLCRSPEWDQLRAGLAAVGGGGLAAAALAARALAAARGGAPAARQLVEALQAVTWEKLHLGTWSEVVVEWRDAYSLACLLAALEALREGKGEAAHEGAPPLAQLALGPVQRALRQLDLAALMGGPLLRPLVDALIEDLHQRWRALQPAAAAPDDGAAPLRDDDFAAAGPRAAPPPGSLGPRGGPVPLLDLPSLERFAAELMPGGPGGGLHGAPARLAGALDAWPALRRWRSAAYLRRVAGARTVPVELGAHYLAEGWGQGLMTLDAFLDTHLLPPPPSAAAAGPEPPPAPRPPLGYLAQHALLEQVPALGRDVSTPEYVALGPGPLVAANAWLGPAGTTTPLHTDPHHNLLCQVAGAKYVRLYSPAQDAALYPHPAGLATNSSRVDLDGVDDDAFPAFRAAPFVDCVLEAGQALYIPPRWWHYVRALTPAFSVSYWWGADSGEQEQQER